MTRLGMLDPPAVLPAPLPGADRVRAVVQRLLLFPLLRLVCRPFRVTGPLPMGRGPYVLVANHASHLDAASVLAALPPALRRRTAAAAAEDYFFATRWRGLVARLGVGAFPFPRRGTDGLQRVEALLAAGWSVVIFPEGTRSRDGRVGRFRTGVGKLSARGATLVPVGLAGTAAAWPKGARLPRRAPVSVAFGPPLAGSGTDAAAVARRVEAVVGELHASAASAASAQGDRPRLRGLAQRAGAFARSRAALVVAFGWGIAEALVWPVVPDFLVAALAVTAPARAPALAAAAICGSVAGGAAAWLLAATPLGSWLLAHAPLVTERMRGQAAEWLTAGPAGLLHQPMSGIPFKVFAYQSADLPLLGFLGYSAVARGVRVLGVAAVFALGGLAARRVLPHLYAAFLALYTVSFFAGLSQVVAAWS